MTIILLHTTAKKNLHSSLIVLIGDDKHIIALLQLSACHRHNNLIGTPQTRDNELYMSHATKLSYSLACNGRINDNKLSNTGVIVFGKRTYLKVARTHKQLTYEHHSKNNTKHTKRIGYSRSQCHRTTRHTNMLQSLSGSTQSRGIGCCTTKQTNHVGQIDSCNRHKDKSKQSAHNDNGKAPQIESHTLVTKRTEEVGTNMQA